MEEEKMLRNSLIVTVIVTLFTLTASASVINTNPNQFAVLAGGTLSTDANVFIGGLTGAVGNTSLGHGTTLTDCLYTTGSFSLDQHVTIDGDVLAGGNVSVGHHSSIGSIDSHGNIFLDQFATINGNLTGANKVTISKSVLVDGDVNYGGKFSADRKASITGLTGNDISDLSTWNSSLRIAPDSWVSGSQSLYYGNNSTEMLAPGTYGSVSISNASTITLTAGTYNFSSLWMGNAVNLIADTSAGDVIINIADSLSTGNKVEFQRGDGGLFTLNVNENIYLGQNTLADANFIGFGDSMSIDQNTVINGSLYSAGNIWLATNVTVAGAGSVPVPEPGTCLILLTGIFAMGGWKKMKIARR
jgi:cytoskeletal protein CcmA (bactofilin family)